MQREADGHRNAGAYHQGSQTTDGIADLIGAGSVLNGHDGGLQKANVELLSQGVEDGAHQQGTEQTLGHGTKGIEAIALGRKNDVLAFEECADVCHLIHFFQLRIW